MFSFQVFDHVIQRNERLSRSIRGECCNGELDSSVKNEDGSNETEANKESSEKEPSAAKEDSKEEESDKPNPVASLDEQVKDWNAQLVKENKNLHRLNTSLHERNHFLSLKQAEFEELINAETTKNEELQNKVDDLEYELTKYRTRNGKLETVLVDTQVKINEFLTNFSKLLKLSSKTSYRKNCECIWTKMAVNWNKKSC